MVAYRRLGRLCVKCADWREKRGGFGPYGSANPICRAGRRRGDPGDLRAERASRRRFRSSCDRPRSRKWRRGSPRSRRSFPGWFAKSTAWWRATFTPAQHRERAAYRWAVDVTVYVDAAHRPAGRRPGTLHDPDRDAATAGIFQGLCRDHAAESGQRRGARGGRFRAGGDLPTRSGTSWAQWRDVGWWQLPLRPEVADPPEPIPIGDLRDLPARIRGNRPGRAARPHLTGQPIPGAKAVLYSLAEFPGFAVARAATFVGHWFALTFTNFSFNIPTCGDTDRVLLSAGSGKNFCPASCRVLRGLLMSIPFPGVCGRCDWGTAARKERLGFSATRRRTYTPSDSGSFGVVDGFSIVQLPAPFGMAT